MLFVSFFPGTCRRDLSRRRKCFLTARITHAPNTPTCRRRTGNAIRIFQKGCRCRSARASSNSVLCSRNGQNGFAVAVGAVAFLPSDILDSDINIAYRLREIIGKWLMKEFHDRFAETIRISETVGTYRFQPWLRDYIYFPLGEKPMRRHWRHFSI